MDNYIGVKLIKAEPCTRGEHSISKGFDKVLGGDAEDEGYKVIYPDGYESWSPKEAFETTYFKIGEDSKLSPKDVEDFTGRIMSVPLSLKSTLVSCSPMIKFEKFAILSCLDEEEYDRDKDAEMGGKELREAFRGYLEFVLQWAKDGLHYRVPKVIK